MIYLNYITLIVVSLFYKVTVLLNRRGVVSFEQLLLDISEALGFPRWHRARVTRLYTTHAREVRLNHRHIKETKMHWWFPVDYARILCNTYRCAVMY